MESPYYLQHLYEWKTNCGLTPGALPSYSKCDADCGSGEATSEKQCPAGATENSICYESVVDCNTVPCDGELSIHILMEYDWSKPPT